MTQEETMIMALSERVNSLAEHVLCIWAKVDALEKRACIYTDTYKGHAVTAEHEPTFDNVHHCGLDTVSNEEELQSLEDLLGMEVVAICGSKTKCEGCARGNTDCVKLELVGGDYICLAKPEQDKPNVISFDEQEDTAPNIMGAIKEKVDDFMNYLDSIVKTEE